MRKDLNLFICFIISIYSYAQETITLEDIWKDYKFYAKSIKGFKSMKDGEHYSTLEKGENNVKIHKHNFETGNIISTIMNTNDERLLKMRSYKFDQSENLILIPTNTESIYRHSSRSIYYIYDVINKSIEKVNDNKIMYATFSPNGEYIAYVFNNNLYVYNLGSKSTIQITYDGEKNKIINGASDWVYEEEFKLVRSFEWSNDSKFIAYYRFDESNIQEFSMDIFKGGLYPTQETFKYPKAGEDNSTVSLHLYNITDNKTTDIRFTKHYEYLPRIKWFYDKSSKLIVYGMNRHQNELDFLIVSDKGDYQVLFTETDEYYIDIHDNLTYVDNEKAFIWTSEKSGYNHIYLKYLNGDERKITKGSWEIKDFYGLDNDLNIYYSSTKAGSINRVAYVTNLLNKEFSQEILTRDTGTNQLTFSHGMKYFVNKYSDANTPNYITLNRTIDKKIIKVLEENTSLQETLSKYNLSKKEYFNLITEDNVELNAWIMKPVDFNPNEEYPLFMFVYGGPGNQQVRNSWDSYNYFWYQILNQEGYIVACVDNRGTGGKGAEFKKMTYKQLGKYETIDQIHAAKYFGSLDYIDEKRIGIQGWSYGGYMSSLAITKGSDVFKTAIAVAPVTNWRYYDNIYTERYMRTPQENSMGYDDNSPIYHVEKLKGNYLLIHGSADDNVHVQNTYEMVSALVKANKQFDLFIYPDKNHGIYGGNTRYHLYNKMTDFILDNL